jgi:hypothetical protein
MADEKIIDTHVRMPEMIHTELTRKAKENRRSVNSEMVVALEKHIGDAPSDGTSRPRVSA